MTTTTTTTTGVDIYLPKGCTSIDRWKVKVGSSVRQGEVLAVASAMTKKTFATDTPFSTSVVAAAAAAAAAHKRPRPKLKSKGGLAIIRHNPYTASSTSSSSHTGSSVSSSSDDVVVTAAVSAAAVAVAAAAVAAAAVATIRRDSRKEGTAMNQPHNRITGGMNSGSSSSGGGDTVFVLEEVLVRAPAPGFLVSQWSNAELQQARSKYKSTATSSISIGRIEPCRHPTVLGNLCAVCGMTTTSSMTNHNAPSHPTTTHPYNNNNNGTSTTTATPLLVRPKPRPRKQTPPLIASKHSSLSTSASTLMSSTAAIPASSATTANNASSTSRSGGEGLKSSSFSSLVQRVQQQQQPPQQKSKQPPPRTNPLKLSALLRTAGGASSRQGGFPTKHHTTNENDGTNHDTHSDTNNNDMTHVTVSGGVTMKVSSEEAMSFARQTTARLRNARKLSLVLDLDHTLLHAIAASQDPNTNRIWMEQEDVRTLSLPVEVLPIPPTSGTAASASAAVQQQQTILMMRHYVKLRPHLTTFLQESMEGYEISVYTAGTRTYANKVTQLICRHMVGAKVDDYEEWVAYMRRTLKEAQDVLQKAKQQSQPHSSKKATKKSKKSTTQPRSVTATSVTTPADTTTIDLSTLGKIPKKKKTEPPLLNNNHESNKNRTTSSDEKKVDEDTEEAMVVNKGETSKDMDVGVTTVGEDASCQKGGTEGKRKRVSFEASVNVDLEERAQRYKELIDKSTKEIDRIQKELAHAERMEALAIDLRKKIFGSRIVSRTDVGDLGRDVKSLRRVFPCGGTLATIVDDREDVWANATNNSTGRPGEPPDNLLLVRPYHWKNFLGYADVNNASGVDISSTEDSTKQQESSTMQKKNAPETEGDNERQLLWTADILKRLHARYYSEQLSDIERDSLTVPGILKQMRREVLGSSVAAARLVFSGLIPIHKQQHSSDGPKKPRFSVTRYAEELGAMVQPNVDLKTTSHVVAARDGTDKIKKARQTKGCKVVKVSWLMECFWSMTRRDETPHLIIGASPKEHGSEASFPNGPTPSFTGTDTSADSDNSLADDFENDFLL